MGGALSRPAARAASRVPAGPPDVGRGTRPPRRGRRSDHPGPAWLRRHPARRRRAGPGQGRRRRHRPARRAPRARRRLLDGHLRGPGRPACRTRAGRGTRAALGPGDRANRHAMAARVEDEGPGFVADAMLPNLVGAETHERRPDVVATVRALVAEQDGAAIAWAQRAMGARPDSSALLRDTEVPTLVVRGEQDTLIPVGEADALAALMPKAEVVTLAGAGHLPPLEAPEELTGAVARWLE